MKKTLIALAAVAATGASFAQVTIYGKMDLGVRQAIGSADADMAQASSSRVGFKGSEDLGGGLKANFAIEKRFLPDNGMAASALDFHGQTVVGLSGGFGDLKLGRFYTPAFLGAQLSGDPFGWDGVANQAGSTGAGVAVVRFNNGFFYTAPAIAGLNVGFAYSMKEGTDRNAGTSLNAKYSVAGLTAQLGLEKTNSGNKYTGFDVAYDLGMAKVGVNIGRGKTLASAASTTYALNAATGNVDATTTAAKDAATNKTMTLRAVVPMGAITGKFAYGTVKTAGVTTSAKMSLGGRYALSKRTDIYASVTNDSKKADHKSGYELGITHNF